MFRDLIRWFFVQRKRCPSCGYTITGFRKWEHHLAPCKELMRGSMPISKGRGVLNLLLRKPSPLDVMRAQGKWKKRVEKG